MSGPPTRQRIVRISRSSARDASERPSSHPVAPSARGGRLWGYGLRIAAVFALLTAIAGVGLAALYLLWFPSFAEEKVRDQLDALSSKLGQEITFSHLEMASTDRAVLHDVALARHDSLARHDRGAVLSIPRVEVEVNIRSVLGGKPQIDEVALLAPHIDIVREEDGTSDLDPLLEAIEARLSRRGGAGEGGGSRRSLPEVTLTGGTMRIQDHMRPESVEAAKSTLGQWLRKSRSPVEFVRDIHIKAHFAGGKTGPGTRLTARAVLEPSNEPMPLTIPRQIEATLQRVKPLGQDDHGWRAEIDLKPSLVVSRLPALPFAKVSVKTLRLPGADMVEVGGVSVSTRGTREPLFEAKAIRAQTPDPLSLRLGALTVEGATVRLKTRRDGASNIRDILELVLQRDARSVLATARSMTTPRKLVVEPSDAAPSARLDADLIERLPTEVFARGSQLIWTHQEGRQVRTWSADAVDLALRHKPGASALSAEIAFRDAAGHASKAEAELIYRGEPEFKARFEGLDAVSLVKHAGAPGAGALRSGRISGKASVKRPSGRTVVELDVRGEDLGFYHPKVSKLPFAGVSAGVAFKASWHPQRGDLRLERGRLRLEDATEVRFGAELLGIGHGEPRAAIDLRKIKLSASMSDTPAQDVLDAIPLALKAEIDGMKMRGKIGFEMSATIDPRRISHMQFKKDVRLDGFRIADYNDRTDVRKLRGSFVHQVIQPETGYKFRVRADGEDWTPLRRVSGYVIKALRTNEDGSFYSHKGFSWRQIRATIEQNVRARRVVRGASTVSMQLSKNVFLSHERTAARKLQEALLTYAMEEVEDIPKNRILEIYLNIVEWGPNVYGIKSAARHYFNKSPGGLNVGESVFLISILPGPRKFHRYKERGYISDFWWARMQRLIAVMLERNHINQEEHDAAIEKRPWFRRANGIDADPSLDEIPNLWDDESEDDWTGVIAP